jgi:uncharacterized protein (TIGR02118 family)
MHKLLVLYPHPQDERKFRPYYEEVHLPLVEKLPGIKAYRHSFSIAGAAGDSPFYCIFEAEFADAATFGAAMQSAEGAAVRADTENFATTPATVVHYDVAG